ncbi:uncharacterized protein [Rutidosis leptorrhynchoides]|uniref:uncharacterized protein n=1 Tax=Rutidosis leptorrhynchoides TaxID=125765 RepID=UPI003A996669
MIFGVWLHCVTSVKLKAADNDATSNKFGGLVTSEPNCGAGEQRVIQTPKFRLNIVIDVASALDYIHNQCGSPMVHCDIKPSSVLLDSDFVAHLGDFGLARFIQQDYIWRFYKPRQFNWKYGMGSKMSPYGDIYSFGILILELFTGKRPTNDMFSNSLNLHDYVKVVMGKCFVLVCFVPSVSSVDAGNERDHLALLSVKAHIKSDPYQILPTWNDSTHFCNWTGVLCSSRHTRVVTLNLTSGGFLGTISPAVGNLSFLRTLVLSNNRFTGKVPQEVGKLSRLRWLGITTNLLSGEIPSNISQCLNLIFLNLSGNNFVGIFPNEFHSLSRLQYIDLHSNNLTGEIPKFIGNFTSLEIISGSGNNFHGSIPDTLGQLSNLWWFGFGSNSLSGVLPPSFFNISSLKTIDLPNNLIGGNLPQDIAQRFPGLVSLNVAINKLTGLIPVSLTNAFNVEQLALTINEFTGSVPSFDRLTRLTRFTVDANHLGNGKFDDLNFVSSLANCTNLSILDFGNNNLGGVLPKSMFNFTQLTELTIGGNLISGSIPYEIGQLVKITRLFMFSNLFTGTIPDSIGNLVNVGAISLWGNLLSGPIPSSLGNLTQLSRLWLYTNNLVGQVPSSLSNCKGLQQLGLQRNNLSGFIPEEIIGLSSLTVLDLSDNHFVGPLPSDVGKLRNSFFLNISNNKLSGVVPSSLGACTSLVVLSISGNVFQGEIPSTFSSLRGIEILDLSRNNLTGTIPEFLEDFVFLESLNLSFNSFKGKLPDKGAFRNVSKVSVNGNAKLCGGFPDFQLPECLIDQESSKKTKISRTMIIMIPILGAIFVLVVALVFYLICKRRYSNKASSRSNSDNENFPRISYRVLHEATDGFSSANLIGYGKFSLVYKAVLNQKYCPETVAVKVLKLAVRGADKTFVAECEALRKIRHRNLVKVITSCSGVDFKGDDFKALIYAYMVNGSLDEWLHQNRVVNQDIEEETRSLNFIQRLNVVIDVASALVYIHCQCGSPLVHCDIKPSNVLLDVNLVAHLGDFGLARFFQYTALDSTSSHTNSTGVKGTVGYAAPEYGLGSRTSTYGDIYSFGILILETFTGKHPTHEMFSDGLSLRGFVKTAIPDRVMEITDLIQLRTYKSIKECLTSVYEIGINCSMESPSDRMDINDAFNQLQFVKKTFLDSRSNLA